MAIINSLAEFADIIGVANLFLNTKQTKQLKMLRLILSQQAEIKEKLDEMEKLNHADDRKAIQANQSRD